MLNGCKYCYCCNGIRRATGKNSKNFMQAFQPGRQRVPFPTYPTPPACPQHKLVPVPMPMPTSRPLQAHYSPAEWQHYERQYPMGPRLLVREENTGTGSRKSGFNVAGCLRCCASCNGPSCELFKCVESPAS